VVVVTICFDTGLNKAVALADYIWGFGGVEGGLQDFIACGDMLAFAFIENKLFGVLAEVVV